MQNCGFDLSSELGLLSSGLGLLYQRVRTYLETCRSRQKTKPRNHRGVHVEIRVFCTSSSNSLGDAQSSLGDAQQWKASANLIEPGRRPFERVTQGTCSQAPTRNEAIRSALDDLKRRLGGLYGEPLQAAMTAPEKYIIE